MTAKQARFAKHAKAMARLYCFEDGTQPGPTPPLSLILKNVYRGFRLQMLPVFPRLLAQFKAMPSDSAGTTVYW
jgi:hypothetical protein